MAWKKYADYTPAEKESLRIQLVGMNHRIEYHDVEALRLRRERQDFLRFLRTRRKMSYPNLAEVAGMTHQGAQYAVKKRILKKYGDT